MNPFKGIRIEFHILQSFPVSCLNRDEVGAPKTAMIGGTTRARVSSQCWKRAIRLHLQGPEMGLPHGTRTKLIAPLIEKECLIQGATQVEAEQCGQKIERIFIKDSTEKTSKKRTKDSTDEEFEDEIEEEKSDTLLFLSPSEVTSIALALKGKGFNPNNLITEKDSKKQAKELAKIIGKPKFNYEIDGIDISLFGRMVAQATKMNVEAASSFAHALSTHKVNNEIEFFTALDDCEEKTGSAHVGILEFNSATYYRYINLDLGQLFDNLAGKMIPEAVSSFIKALYLANPSARQTTMRASTLWDFAEVIIRKGQPLSISFEEAIKSSEGYVEPSKLKLTKAIKRNENLAGSLYGKINSFTYGEDENFNIDKLIEYVNSTLRGIHE